QHATPGGLGLFLEALASPQHLQLGAAGLGLGRAVRSSTLVGRLLVGGHLVGGHLVGGVPLGELVVRTGRGAGAGVGHRRRYAPAPPVISEAPAISGATDRRTDSTAASRSRSSTLAFLSWSFRAWASVIRRSASPSACWRMRSASRSAWARVWLAAS